jgi:hypothetical protein
MPYPEDDKEFKDQKIDSVSEQKDGAFTITCDGWSLWCGKECPAKPATGQTARMYGRGIGFAIRGLFIDGVKVWYRSEADEKNHREIESYGADAKDWLARWDRGDTCWTLEMGGLGPGYEQCIHITCAEILRWFIENNCDAAAWDNSDKWKADCDKLQSVMFKSKVVNELGLSGAQYGAALSIASSLYMRGPREVMRDEQTKDRHIQVSRRFPGSVAA